MRVRFADDRLRKVEDEGEHHAGLPAGVARRFRERMQVIRDAANERELYLWKSLHVEKLKGKRRGQSSMRLNDQYRLVFEIEHEPGGNVLVVVSIEDYH